MNSDTQTGQPPTRREKERLARRQLILDAARTVFAQRGFHAAKLEEVAERAEFGKATLYSYFDTKESLFDAVLEDVFGHLLRRATAAFSSDAPFIDKISMYVAQETAYFFQNPEGLHLMMSESSHLRGENPLIRLMPRYMDVMQRAIEQEQEAGGIRRDLDAFDLGTTLRLLVFGQFFGRIHRLIEELDMLGRPYTDAQLVELTERIKEADIEQEVSRATTFITTVFLTGAGT